MDGQLFLTLALFNVNHIIENGGVLLVGLMIFAESGMFLGFFFPGDTLLISAGILAADKKISLISVIIAVIIAAILGDNFGYTIGKKFGRKLFRKDSVIFSPDHVKRTENFYAKYGSKTMLIAHFIPVIRTFAPSTAGLAEMDRLHFFVFDAIGDSAWAILVSLLGYYFGKKVPGIDHYILYGVGAVIIITISLSLGQVTKSVKKNNRVKKANAAKKDS